MWKTCHRVVPKDATAECGGSEGPSLKWMPRPTRSFTPEAIYHIIARGNRRQPIFLGDLDCRLFLEILPRVVVERQWTVHSYCLMPNHYHLLLETRTADLSPGMREVNGAYAQWFNRLHGFVGHVFQGRFKAILVASDWHLLELTRYMATNPSRAGLCDSPGLWQWSSYPWLITERAEGFAPSSKLLALFGNDESSARNAMRRFVEDK
jgi:REP element-mobilizing transposase RayT